MISQRVNAFAVRREGIEHTDPKTGKISSISLYRITLQLIDRLPAGLANSASKGSELVQSPDILISDYMETAIPEFLHGKRLEPFGSQNWHTGITGFSDRLSPPW